MSAESDADFRENVGHFHDAALLLRKSGRRVCNPARVWACRWPWLYKLLGLRLQSLFPLRWRFDHDLAYRRVLIYDLWLLSRSDALCLIDNWRESRGAKVEENVAYRLAIPKLYEYRREPHALVSLTKKKRKGDRRRKKGKRP